MKKQLSRRTFLRGLGGLTVSLPLLEAGLAGNAFAQTEMPKRFIVFFHPNGVIPETWFPTSYLSETDFELGPSHNPLEPFKQKLVVLDGINMDSAHADYGPGEPHQRGMGIVLSGTPLQDGSFVGGDGSLSGWGDGITVDQVIANHVGGSTRFGSLELGVRADNAGGGEVRTRISYRGPADPLPPQNDPVAVFDRIFSDFETEPNTLAELRNKRGSVLDAVLGQFNSLRARVGVRDRAKLDEHAMLVRDLESRLQSDASPSEFCMLPQRPLELPVDDASSMPDISRSQIDLMVMAMACDLTRVGSIQYSNAKNHINFPWLNSNGDGHALSHAGPTDQQSRTEWTVRDTWFAQEYAYLLSRLDSIPEGDGTMLDNTCVLWINELAQGNTHSHTRMPFVLAGSAGGAIQTGRYLRYNGASHNDLLVSLQNAFGVDSPTIGDPRFVTGPLSGLLA